MRRQERQSHVDEVEERLELGGRQPDVHLVQAVGELPEGDLARLGVRLWSRQANR